MDRLDVAKACLVKRDAKAVASRPLGGLLVLAACGIWGCGGQPWKQIRPTEAGFSVEMPGEATASPFHVVLKDGPVQGKLWCVLEWSSLLHELGAREEGRPHWLCTLYLPLPVRARPSDTEGLIAELKAQFLLPFEHGEWLPESTRGDAGTSPARREFLCRGELERNDVMCRVGIWVRTDRAYILYAIGSTKWTVTSPYADRFFDSFVILDG